VTYVTPTPASSAPECNRPTICYFHDPKPLDLGLGPAGRFTALQWGLLRRSFGLPPQHLTRPLYYYSALEDR
jgi:hypothetical protein